MKYFIPILLILNSCSYHVIEQTNQDRIYEKSQSIREEDKKSVLLGPQLFDSLVNYADTITEIPENLSQDPKRFLGPLSEKNMNIIDYGSIKHGKLINIGQGKDVIEIIDNLLFVRIMDGGGFPVLPTTICNLIWNGKHYSNSEGEMYIELVFSYVNPDLRRAIVRRLLQFDLANLRHPDTNRIKISIHGYSHYLYYNY